jgi:hypothetical protein
MAGPSPAMTMQKLTKITRSSPVMTSGNEPVRFDATPFSD